MILKTDFPPDFIWGAATAALQIEGSPTDDGGGESSWTTLAKQPGAIINDDDMNRACDFYHRYKQDVQLMKQLGIKAFRMSMAWPRILPTGDGKINQKGLDFYNAVIDELLANDITPFVTCFHWETPQSLEDRFGGWRSKETSKRLGEYAGILSKNFSDRVTNWFTVNEIPCFAHGGYAPNSGFPPRAICTAQEVNQCVHNAVLGHGYAMQALRANAKSKIKAGIVHNSTTHIPAIVNAENIAAAKLATYESNSAILAPIFEGKYPPCFTDRRGADMPIYDDAELKVMSTPMDTFGYNLYRASSVVADKAHPWGYREIAFRPSYPKLDMDWLQFSPDAAYWGPKFHHELFDIKEMYIAENGCAAADTLERSGECEDIERVLYLRYFLKNFANAAADGVPIKGYFVWSFMDNFEWTCGYAKRFGITYVNYNTQQRTPKMSFKLYQDVIRNNAVL